MSMLVSYALDMQLSIVLVERTAGEFEDSATLKAFGQEGHGLFPGSTAMEKEISRQYQVQVVRRVDSVRQKFYAITVERRVKHPVVMALFDAARREVLS